LFTNNNFSKLFDYKFHISRLVSVLVKEKIILVLIWDLTMPNMVGKKTHGRKYGFAFCHHRRRHFVFLIIHLVSFENQQLYVDKLKCFWFICASYASQT
jgi:hypothetical protein